VVICYSCYTRIDDDSTPGGEIPCPGCGSRNLVWTDPIRMVGGLYKEYSDAFVHLIGSLFKKYGQEVPIWGLFEAHIYFFYRASICVANADQPEGVKHALQSVCMFVADQTGYSLSDHEGPLFFKLLQARTAMYGDLSHTMMDYLVEHGVAPPLTPHSFLLSFILSAEENDHLYLQKIVSRTVEPANLDEHPILQDILATAERNVIGAFNCLMKHGLEGNLLAADTEALEARLDEAERELAQRKEA
jgi:DNA-directed RNA polymerase subunit RPC12/RpoP